MKVPVYARSGASFPALVVAFAAGLVGVFGFEVKSYAQSQDAESKTTSPPGAVRQYRDAVAFQNRGVYDLAVDEWQKFLEKFPDDPLAAKARHYAGVCKLQLKQFDDAIADFRHVLEQHPKFELLDVTYLNLGLTQYNLAQADQPERFDDAAKTLAMLVEKFPDSKQIPQALYYLGESLYSRGRLEESIKAYSHLVEKHAQAAQRPDALYALGAAQEQLGRHADAGATYDKFLKEYAGHALRPEVILRRAETLFAQKQFAAAEKWFASATAVKDFAQSDQALMRQAASLYEQKKYAEAASLYASLAEKFPDSVHKPAAVLAAGNCFYLAGELSKAKPLLAQAMSASGAPAVEAAHWLTRIALKERQPQKAIEIVRQISKSAGDAPYAVNLVMDEADALYEIPEQRTAAIERYASIAEQYPQHALAAQALYMAAFTALGVGQHEQAVAYADKFLANHSGDSIATDVRYVAAEAQIQLGQPAAAEKLYRELLKSASQHVDADAWRIRLGLSLLLQKKHEEVVKLLSPLVAGLKKPDQVAEAYHIVGSAQLELADYGTAAKSLSAALTAAPKGRQADETLLNLAAAQKQQNKMVDARETLERLVKEVPDSKLRSLAQSRLGEYAYSAGDLEAAAKQYQQLLDNFPDSPQAASAIYGLGWTQLGQKDYAASEKSLSQFLERHRGHDLAPRAHYARAMARQQLKRYDESLADVEAFLGSRPSDNDRSDALYVKGLVLAGQEKFSDAAQTFRQILDEDPKYASSDKVRYELAWALKSQNDEAGANSAFRDLADKHADSPLAAEALYHVAENAYSAKDYSAASETYQAALSKAGTSDIGEKAAHKLAWSYYQQGQFDKANQGFDTQLSTYPQGELAADARFMSAESHFKLGKYKAAAEAFQRSLEAPPANKDFISLALLHAAQAANQTEDYSTAIKLAQRHAQELPDSIHAAEALFENAWALEKQNKPDDAFKLYEQVADSAEREIGARARFMMGEILFGKKDYREAVRNYFKVAYGYGYPSSPDAIKKWQASSVYEAAICFENLNMKQQALKSYQELLEKYPNSERAADAKKRAAALQG